MADLIQTADPAILFDCMTEYDDSEIDMEDDRLWDELDSFSYDRCKYACLKNEPVYYQPGEDYFIRDSLFCEYGYVIDLDRQELEFYIGAQTAPQKDNRFGNASYRSEYMDTAYYPCRLMVVFTLEYVKAMDADRIVEAMKAAEESEEFCRFEMTEGRAGGTAHKDYAPKLKSLSLELDYFAQLLREEAKRIMDIEPVSMQSLDRLERQKCRLGDEITALQEIKELMRRLD